MHERKERHFTYLLILAMLLWGGGWSALKVLTYELPMDVIIFWRFFVMSVAFIPILYLFKTPFAFSKPSIKYIAGGSFLNIAFMVSAFLGVKYGLAGAGGVIITSFSPLMTFFLVALIFRKRLSNQQYFGLFLGLISGYILLELSDLSLFLSSANFYFLLCALIWAGVTLLSQHSQKYIHPIYYSFVISIIATLLTFFYAYDSGLLVVFDQGFEFWLALIYLGVLGQSVATTIFFVASGKLGSEKSSSFMFLVPVFALFFAWLLLDEPMQLHIIAGGALSMLAVYFINKKAKD